MEILRYPLIKSALRSRWPQFILTTFILAGFALAIIAGFFGTPVGSRNFGIVFTWIAWWALLILFAVPFLGRGWCAVCPIPVAGEWLQRGSVLGPDKDRKGAGLSRAWPKWLRNIWLQNVAFTLVALFSAVILTTPSVSALILVIMLLLALGLSVIFERRAFCRYVCPVSGFIGLYAQAAPIELRVINKSTCAKCTEKSCYNGSEVGYGCPWGVFPGGLMKNNSCGLCLECLRTCPNENISLHTRPFGADLGKPSGRRFDESMKAFIMLGAAIVYSTVLLGPWGKLKQAAYGIGTPDWFGYAGIFLLLIYGVLPSLLLVAVITGRKMATNNTSLSKTFVAQSYSLIPLGLMAWVAFSLSFVLNNASYIWMSLSDPLGWGWNLFGTSSIGWTPYLSGWLPMLQGFFLVVGLVWSVRTSLKISSESLKGRNVYLQALPVIVFCLMITLLILVLLL